MGEACSTHMKERLNAYEIYYCELEGTTQLQGPRRRWRIILKSILKNRMSESVDLLDSSG
jgi:hypothetical protein